MTRVVVTGGSGKLGRAVVRDLHAHGYEVVTLDRAAPPPDAPGSFTRVDLTDHGQVREALTRVDDRYDGVDAVVHLAAVPAPGLIPDSATFANNVVATYNVFAAARAAGIRNVVWASSETLLGLPLDQNPPPYLPVDEDYPVAPTTSYSLAKAAEEEIARHFARWQPGAKVIGLRFSNVMEPADYADFPSFEDDPTRRIWNVWAYIDARDGAQAVRLALESDVVGAEVFVVANTDSVMTTPSAELAARWFPQVPLRGAVVGTASLMSSAKAQRVLGFAPVHSWRDGPV